MAVLKRPFKVINVGAIASTIYHSFNRRVKHEFAPTTKADSGDSNPRPSAPEALALSMLCNETTMYKKSPLNVGFYIYAVDSDFAT